MFEVRKGMTCVNGVVFETFERDAQEGNVSFEVEAGTTGACGGGREKGGRAYVRILNEQGDFYARTTKNDNGRPNGIVIAVSGDHELMALIKALEFAAETLNDQLLEMND